jgi:hypothetical protein
MASQSSREVRLLDVSARTGVERPRSRGPGGGAVRALVRSARRLHVQEPFDHQPQPEPEPLLA